MVTATGQRVHKASQFDIQSAAFRKFAHYFEQENPAGESFSLSEKALSEKALSGVTRQFASIRGKSLFSFLYFFAIVVACARLGADTGIAVTIVSTILFVQLSYFATPAANQEWNRLLLRPSGLIVIGYILTYWARGEHGLRRKLEFLRQVSSMSNPRFGVDRTTGHFMESVLEFFKADTCIVLERHAETEQYQLRCATARDPKAGNRSMPAPYTINAVLQAVADVALALYAEQRRLWRLTSAYRTWDAATQAPSSRATAEASPLVEWLEGGSFIVVRMRRHEWFRGYVFLSSRRRGAFRMEDAKFLLQLVDQVTPVREHIRWWTAWRRTPPTASGAALRAVFTIASFSHTSDSKWD
jgi:hypothetical protein